MTTSTNQTLSRDEVIAEAKALGFTQFHGMISGWVSLDTFAMHRTDSTRYGLRTVAGEPRIYEVRDALCWNPVR